MKVCPVCDTQNQDGAKNCETCGESLGIPQVAAPPGAEAAPAAAKAAVAAKPAAAAAATAAKAAPPAAAAATGPKFCPIEGLEDAPGSPEHEDGYFSCGAKLQADPSLVA